VVEKSIESAGPQGDELLIRADQVPSSHRRRGPPDETKGHVESDRLTGAGKREQQANHLVAQLAYEKERLRAFRALLSKLSLYLDLSSVITTPSA
jgi:hypothetical protein